MQKLCLISVLSMALAAAPHSSAQLLPDRFAGWQPGQHPPLVMWPRSPEAAKFDTHLEHTKVLVESGVARVEEHYYRNGNSEVAVRAFKLRDPSSAYEVYTSLLRTGMLPARVSQVAAFSKDHVLIQVGNLVLESTANASRDDLNALVRAVEATTSKEPLPPIPNYLPMQGRVPGSERYALGPAGFRAGAADLDRAEFATLVDEVGFKSGAEAMFAQYRTPKDTAVLLLVEYPTPQLAEQHLRHLEQVIPAAAKQAGTSIERKASLLSLILKPSSVAYGDSLRNAVKYETEVTWNEPHQTMTDPPILTTLVKIILSTCLFMVVAVVLGVAFGGVRVLAKIFFPGKVFDRPEQMDVLQLGLSGKRINSRDFY
jgi:hypothetical protein